MGRQKRESSTITKTFADRLGDLVEEKKATGLSHNEICEQAGVGSGAMSDWLSDNKTASIDSLGKLARYFNVSADWLLGFTEDRNKNPAAADMLNLSFEAITQIMALGDGKLKKTLDNFLTDPDFVVFLYTLNEIATSTKLHYADESNVDYDEWSIDDFEKDSELHSDLTEYVRFKLHERDAMIISGDFLIDLLKLKLNDALNEIVTGIINISIEEAKTDIQK